MAQLLSNGNLDFRQFNLREAFAPFDNFEFFENQNLTADSSDIPGLAGTYTAQDVAGWWSGPGTVWDAENRILVGGLDVVLDANGDAQSGWVTGLMGRTVENGISYHFDMVGFLVGAVAFQAAAISFTMTDDLALLRTALSKADRIVGSSRADFAYGWTGNDRLLGNGGNDTLSGDAGSDTILGGRGNDSLQGGLGGDKLTGERGNDQLNGGAGGDTLTGGAGSDRFIFLVSEIANDQVTDFQDGLDSLVLRPAGNGVTVEQLLAAASDITGGVRFDIDGAILTVMGITKADLADQVFLA